jgi:hypothetical protein
MLKRACAIVIGVLLLSPINGYSNQYIKIDAGVRFRAAALVQTEQTMQSLMLSAWFPDELLPQIQYCEGPTCRTYIPRRQDLPTLLVLQKQGRSISVQVSYF